MRLLASDIARFRSKLRPDPETGCLVYTGGANPRYGVFWAAGRTVLAHRFALELALGRRIRKRRQAAHGCHSPLCCRYGRRHVHEATPLQNSGESRVAGRLARGERHGRARLRERDVRRILGGRWKTTAAAALSLGVDVSRVRAILRGAAWQHIGGSTRRAKR